RIPFIWELNVHGYDYACLERSRPQDPEYYRHNSSDLGVVEHFLGAPAPALSFDLHTLRETDLPHAIHLSRTIVNAGRLDGFAVFFRAHVDDDLTLSSGPLDANRAPHWGFRILRADAENFAAGDTIELTLTVGQWTEPDTWRWTHQHTPAGPSPSPAAA
ncbi:MAG TPA: SAM-dependent methyltransferase, partial [Opitutus sp.]|nr:SAM-dependent methyltransferase [Opitutus sp.]